LHARRFICTSGQGTIPFSPEMQVDRLRNAQAKPKISLADRPILNLQTQIEGYGRLRGKACLMLTRTSAARNAHAGFSTP
jgi:hypothetical protein